MRRLTRFVVAAALAGALLCGAGTGLAEEPGLAQQVAVKLLRGAANFCTGWAEFPKQVYLLTREQGWLVGMTRGTMEGLGMVGARTVAGAYEVLTFPVPIPPDYQPMLKPDYVWQPEPPRRTQPGPPGPAGPDGRPDTQR